MPKSKFIGNTTILRSSRKNCGRCHRNKSASEYNTLHNFTKRTESVDIVCIKKWKVRELVVIQTRLNIQTSAKLTDSIINAKNSPKTSSYRFIFLLFWRYI